MCHTLILSGVTSLSLLSRQWAAVMTYLEATKVPPQNPSKVGLTLDTKRATKTIQGYLFTLNEKIMGNTRKLVQ